MMWCTRDLRITGISHLTIYEINDLNGSTDSTHASSLRRLHSNSVTEYPGGKLAQQPRPVTLRQLLFTTALATVVQPDADMYLENRVDALALGVSHSSEPVAGDCTRHCAGYVGDDKAQGTAARAADHAPEPAGRPVGAVLRHALVAHHLLKDILKLRILGTLPVLGIRGATAALVLE